jgi:hypothetical protein
MGCNSAPFKKEFSMFKKLQAMFLAFIGLMFGAMSSAHAALDAAVTTAVTTAQTDLLALYGALTAAGVAIWVGRLIYRKFTVR